MHLQRLLRFAFGAFLFILLAAALVNGIAFAQDPAPGKDPEIGEGTSLATPKACDNVPKYYCTWIRYAPLDSSHWQLRKRLYKGGIDNGANAWQLWWSKDWFWNASQWAWLVTWPSSS